MYTKIVPFKDFKGNPRNMEVNFNLTETEVFKLLVPFKVVLDWRDSMQGPERTLETEEVVGFYTAFEDILLAAWGVPSEDGLYFRKSGRYEFEESALFNATMVMFISDPSETTKLVEGIMPEGMEELIKTADANLAKAAAEETTDESMRIELERLRAQVAQQEGQKKMEDPSA